MAKNIITKKTNFSFNHSDQVEDYGKVAADYTVVQTNFDSRAGETLTALNTFIDILQAASTGSYSIGHDSLSIEADNVGDALEENRLLIDDKAESADVYTKTELNSGQLDNRYYTEIEVDTKDGALQQQIDLLATQGPNAKVGIFTIEDAINTNDYSGSITGLTLFEDLRLDLVVTNSNTGAVTIDIGDGNGAKDGKYINSQGNKVDIPEGELFGVNSFKYDGIDWVLIQKDLKNLSVNVEEFGAVGDYDGISGTDDTQAFKDMFASGYKFFKLSPNKTYFVTDELQQPDDSIMNFNGAKVLMELDSTKTGWRMGDRTKLLNFKIEVAVTDTTLAGYIQVPISMGDRPSGTGKHDILISNGYIETDKPDGVGIGVWGDSHNIKVENITFPTSPTLGRPLMAHWGNTVDPTAGTTHPHNIVFENCVIGDVTVSTGETAIVYLSGVYNVHVKNIISNRCSDSTAFVYAGDFGFQYADLVGQVSGGKNIKFENIITRLSDTYFATIDGRAQVGGQDVDLSCSFENVVSRSTGDSLTTSAFLIRDCENIVVDGFDLGYFFQGFGFNINAKNIDLKNGKIHNSYSAGLRLNNGVTDVLVENVEVFNNGTGDSEQFKAGMYIDDAVRPVIRNCNSGNADGEVSQSFGFRTTDLTEKAIFENNHVNSVASGGTAYVLGTSTYDVGQIFLFTGNTADDSITAIKTGKLLSPISQTIGRNDNYVSHYVSQFAPSSGTHKAGDIVFYESPTAGGKIGTICVTSGSPGVWKEFGVIDA